jgi:hypothetical protein
VQHSKNPETPSSKHGPGSERRVSALQVTFVGISRTEKIIIFSIAGKSKAMQYQICTFPLLQVDLA